VIEDSARVRDGRFGIVDEHLPPVPAPRLPSVRLKPRG
jgi:quercetin 2,3-dioxygenase